MWLMPPNNGINPTGGQPPSLKVKGGGGRQRVMPSVRRPNLPSMVNHGAIAPVVLNRSFPTHLQTIAEYAIIRPMNKRQRETLDEIFQTPVPATLEWRDFEALLLALGARTVEGRGSRVRFELNGVVAAFRRPHPEKEAKPYQVRDARRFLEQAGIKP
jgi:hypothetical protein